MKTILFLATLTTVIGCSTDDSTETCNCTKVYYYSSSGGGVNFYPVTNENEQTCDNRTGIKHYNQDREDKFDWWYYRIYCNGEEIIYEESIYD